MPIYAYRCDTCGFSKDVLQKMSDAPLTDCPSCEKNTFKKQLTAAGFQLKGSGWYATDFKNGSSSAPAVNKPAENACPAAAACGTACAAANAGNTTSAA